MNFPKYGFLENMAPLLIQVELTEACNLKCKFCYNSQKPKYSTQIMEILETLASQGVMQINLTGGEPLKHPDFFKILDKACSLFPNVILLTNGSLMSKTVLERIHKYNILSTNISIHGDSTLHDSLTQVSGSHEASMYAIKYFLEKDKILVASNFVLNSHNLHQLESTISYLNQIGLKFMTITRFIPVGIGKTAVDLELNRGQLVEAFRIVHEHNSSKAAPHIEIAEATPFCSLPVKLRYLANSCSYGFDRFYVDVNGNLLVCGLSRIPLGGNILKQSILDIKKSSEVFQSFISNEHLHAGCKVCNELYLCHGGCRAAALINGGWKGTKDSKMVAPIN
jgi:radical SAM protein with 4Fe4S-binding SPASM domain